MSDCSSQRDSLTPHAKMGTLQKWFQFFPHTMQPYANRAHTLTLSPERGWDYLGELPIRPIPETRHLDVRSCAEEISDCSSNKASSSLFSDETVKYEEEYDDEIIRLTWNASEASEINISEMPSSTFSLGSPATLPVISPPDFVSWNSPETLHEDSPSSVANFVSPPTLHRTTKMERMTNLGLTNERQNDAIPVYGTISPTFIEEQNTVMFDREPPFDTDSDEDWIIPPRKAKKVTPKPTPVASYRRKTSKHTRCTVAKSSKLRFPARFHEAISDECKDSRWSVCGKYALIIDCAKMAARMGVQVTSFISEWRKHGLARLLGKSMETIVANEADPHSTQHVVYQAKFCRDSTADDIDAIRRISWIPDGSDTFCNSIFEKINRGSGDIPINLQTAIFVKLHTCLSKKLMEDDDGTIMDVLENRCDSERVTWSLECFD